MILNSLCAFFLVLTILSFWLVNKRLVTLFLYLASVTLALITERVSWMGLISLAAFLAGFILVNRPSFSKTLRSLGYLILIAVGVALCLHIAPGFHGWEVISECRVSPTSTPYKFCFNFDKISLGIFILISTPHLLSHTTGQWRRALFSAMFFSLVGVAVLLVLVWSIGYVRWEPKWPTFTFVWVLCNLLFTCVIEEAIFRGFIQNKLMKLLVGFKWGNGAALVLASIVFGLAHFSGGGSYVLLSTVAGLIYGASYLTARRLEASILTHFVVNFVHLLGFSYPALQM